MKATKHQDARSTAATLMALPPVEKVKTKELKWSKKNQIAKKASPAGLCSMKAPKRRY